MVGAVRRVPSHLAFPGRASPFTRRVRHYWIGQVTPYKVATPGARRTEPCAAGKQSIGPQIYFGRGGARFHSKYY